MKRKWEKPQMKFYPLPEGVHLDPNDPDFDKKLTESYLAAKKAAEHREKHMKSDLGG